MRTREVPITGEWEGQGSSPQGKESGASPARGLVIGVLPEQGGSLASYASTGQADRLGYYLSRYLKSFDRVVFFSYGREGGAYHGAEILGNSRGFHRWLYAFWMPLVHRKVFRECDVLRVLQLTGEVPACLARLLYRIPVVGTYGYFYDAHARIEGAGWFRQFLFRLRTKWALRLFEAIIVTAPELAQEVRSRHPGKRILFCPNGVDTHRFSPPGDGVRAEISAERGPVLLFVGRLSPQKNLKLFLSAVARLPWPVTVRLIGDGPERNALEEMGQSMGLRLEMPGVVPHGDLHREYQRADIFVLPSLLEGHPKVLLEAMSCGLPCVASDLPSLRNVIRDGETGLLVSLRPEAVSAAIERLVADRKLADSLGQAARAEVQARFDLPQILNQEVGGLLALAQKVPKGSKYLSSDGEAPYGERS